MFKIAQKILAREAQISNESKSLQYKGAIVSTIGIVAVSVHFLYQAPNNKERLTHFHVPKNLSASDLFHLAQFAGFEFLRQSDINPHVKNNITPIQSVKIQVGLILVSK